jgi:tetratricopeptide (TPR) repeat protein
VHGYPTILFVDGDGNVVVQTAGYQPPKDFAAMLNRVLDLKHIPEWEAAFAADPKNVEALSKLGTAMAMKNDPKAADYAAKAMVLAPTNPNDEFSDLYNAVGDMYQNGNKPDEALKFFEATASTGKDPGKVAYAMISECYCYFMKNDPKNALAVANKAAAIPGLSKSDADSIASIQAGAKKMLNPPKKP